MHFILASKIYYYLRIKLYIIVKMWDGNPSVCHLENGTYVLSFLYQTLHGRVKLSNMRSTLFSRSCLFSFLFLSLEEPLSLFEEV